MTSSAVPKQEKKEYKWEDRWNTPTPQTGVYTIRRIEDKYVVFNPKAQVIGKCDSREKAIKMIDDSTKGGVTL